MAKLFDEIKKDNPDESPEFVHGLNVFLSRLLFCFFAEDTNIFDENQFTKAISSHTQEDGSDLNIYMDKLFKVLNTSKSKRENLPSYLQAFPYVNGGLFRDTYDAPVFTKRSRKEIINSGQLDWSAINPDIFGSMIQAVITPEHRGGLGMHYTSVPNIMKVIEPLFLNDLYEEFEKAKGNNKKLDALLGRIQRIKIFDPACGSGNFLIIAYKELRILEMNIFKERGEFASSGISLGQFYGIELDDFAHEIATLSLWLAEHQMNVEFFKEFGKTNPTLPLKDAGHITHGNATRSKWEEVCPKNEDDEIYILGNPPYLGTRNQEKEHKDDMAFVFKGVKNYKTLDYISAWFYKASKYISNINSKFAFVTTNSICQGDQVGVLWNQLIENTREIYFTYQSFKWTNNAKSNAGVSVVIIGLRNKCNGPKYIWNGTVVVNVNNINPYLVEGKNIIVSRKSKSISGLPKMIKGSIPADGGHLILNENDVKQFDNDKQVKKVIKKFVGAQELIKGINRWCLYITDEELGELKENRKIVERLEGVRKMRLASSKKATVELAKVPHRFAEDRFFNKPCILIPCVTSEGRDYIPIGFINKGPVIYASAQAIYDGEPWVFGILNSKIHMSWVKAVGGRLELRIRYSSSLCYNAFPFPSISRQRKEEINQHVFNILGEREKYPEKTLAQLYDSDKMPDGLREAHSQLDLAVERCYRSKPFESDEERLEFLFKLYEKMIAEEQTKSTLFAEQKKTRKKRK